MGSLAKPDYLCLMNCYSASARSAVVFDVCFCSAIQCDRDSQTMLPELGTIGDLSILRRGQAITFVRFLTTTLPH